MKMNTLPVRKLRSLNSAGLTKGGDFVVSMWTTNRYSARPATAASAQISGELNQSLSWPRSSINCKAPMARLRVAKPKKSKADFLIGVSGMNDRMPRKESTPNGTLMKNTQRQS